ncbi:unnamed protein product, partial [Scytosiphon promiscuus]
PSGVERGSHLGPRCGAADDDWWAFRTRSGLARLQHLVPAPCLGAVMLSQTESWTEES